MNVGWGEINALTPSRRGALGSFRPFSLGWDAVADACFTPNRGNKRCPALNIHAVALEQLPPRCAIRVIPPFWRNAHEEEKKKTHPFFVVYCPVKRASAPSILTQWSFQMLKGGEGVVDGVGWGGGGRSRGAGDWVWETDWESRLQHKGRGKRRRWEEEEEEAARGWGRLQQQSRTGLCAHASPPSSLQMFPLLPIDFESPSCPWNCKYVSRGEMLEINHLRGARLPLERKRAKKIGRPSVSLDGPSGMTRTLNNEAGPFFLTPIWVKKYFKVRVS